MDNSAGTDWVDRFADEVVAEAKRRAPGKPIVCASGLSPSGPIHLGNLREVITPHLVADEIRRRGHECVHLLSWDDYDRFRKVPVGIDPAWAAHIGKPLTSVPAPPGSGQPNWAEHFKAPMIAALAELGVEYHPISQTEMYTSGAYREQILLAMREREKIDAVLDRYRTKGRPAATVQTTADEDEAAAAALAAEGSGAAAEDDGTAALLLRAALPVAGRAGHRATAAHAAARHRPRPGPRAVRRLRSTPFYPAGPHRRRGLPDPLVQRRHARPPATAQGLRHARSSIGSIGLSSSPNTVHDGSRVAGIATR